MITERSPLKDSRTYLSKYTPSFFAIDYVLLDVNLCQKEVIVKSELRIRRTFESAQHLYLNGEALKLNFISLNDRELTHQEYNLLDDGLLILNVPGECVVKLEVSLFPEENKQLMGLYQSGTFLCTQCEPEGFRRITYFIDRPDVLSRFRVTLRGHKAQYPFLLSNGNLLDVNEYQDETGALAHAWIWEDPFPKPCYLFAMVAGDFDCLTGELLTASQKKIALHIYVEKGHVDEAHFAMQALKESMRWDEQVYGCEYDLTAFRIVAIDDFNMGAMENKSLNIFNSKYVLADIKNATDHNILSIFSVVSHEYFHNWSGNRVTCRDWFQLSLKEGLTIFRDQSFVQDLLSTSLMRIHDVMDLKRHQFIEDESTSQHSVRPDSYLEISNFYTATIYNKGAEVLRMLETWIGKEDFNKGIRAYFKKHDGQAVTIEDLLIVLEGHTAKPVGLFASWYDQIGTPHVHIDRIQFDSSKKTVTIRMRQSLAHALKNKIPAVPIPVKCALFSSNGKQQTFELNGKSQDEAVLLLDQLEKEWVLNNVLESPVPSFFRGFSAPVHSFYERSHDEWMTLALHETDGYSKWNAFQKCMFHALQTNVFSDSSHFSFPESVSVLLKNALKNFSDDPYLLSELITLPTVDSIFDEFSPLDRERVTLDHCFAVRDALCEHAAAALKSEWMTAFTAYEKSEHTGQAYSFTEAGRRRLKNACLFYLSYLPEGKSILENQFKNSLGKNMTDTESALSCLSIRCETVFEDKLSEFYTYFEQNRLVTDKWLSLQSMRVSPDTLNRVKTLMKHKAFDLYNPNRVHALIGAFVERNPVCFHAGDGSGYRFLAEIVLEIDQFNSTVAARLAKALTTWPRYDTKRQTLMREQLKMLAARAVSQDVQELVSEK